MSRGPIRCHYALTPQHRPDCQLTATVTYGDIPLCSACAGLRSTLGKGQTPRKLPTPHSPDPLGLLAEVHLELTNAIEQLHAAVARARQHHTTWTSIAAILGTTRQAAQQRFRAP